MKYPHIALVGSNYCPPSWKVAALTTQPSNETNMLISMIKSPENKVMYNKIVTKSHPYFNKDKTTSVANEGSHIQHRRFPISQLYRML